MNRLNPLTFLFVTQVSDVINTSFAALQRLSRCKPSVQGKKPKHKKTLPVEEFKLLLHHLKFGQAMITGTGSYYVRAEKNLIQN